MNEAAFWRWLRVRLPPGDYTRIESEISPGLPDVSYALESVNTPMHGWIELKAVPMARHPFKRNGLRPSQRLWIGHRIRCHVPVAVFGAVGTSVGIWRMSTVHPNRFNSMSIDQLAETSTLWLPRKYVQSIHSVSFAEPITK